MRRSETHHHDHNRQGGTPVSPFHWRELTQRESAQRDDRPSRSAPEHPRAGRALAARERAERILAHRWCGAYSKA